MLPAVTALVCAEVSVRPFLMKPVPLGVVIVHPASVEPLSARHASARADRFDFIGNGFSVTAISESVFHIYPFEVQIVACIIRLTLLLYEKVSSLP